MNLPITHHFRSVRQNGFTIIELIIVVVIIGILASLGLATYQGSRVRAENTKQEAVAEKYQEALGLYALKNGAYPPQVSDGSGGVTGYPTSACLGESYPAPAGCLPAYNNNTFNVALRPFMDGQKLPRGNDQPIKFNGDLRSGIGYYYKPDATLDGTPNPWFMYYYLQGNQKCSLKPLASGPWGVFSSTPPASGVTEVSSEGNGRCIIPLDDPTIVVQN